MLTRTTPQLNGRSIKPVSPYSEGLPIIKHIKFLLRTFNKKAHGNKRKAS
jgi:hypothetical protein